MLAVFWRVFFFRSGCIAWDLAPLPSNPPRPTNPLSFRLQQTKSSERCHRHRLRELADSSGEDQKPLAALLGRSAMLAGTKRFDVSCTPGFCVSCAFIEHLASSTDWSWCLGQVITVIPIFLSLSHAHTSTAHRISLTADSAIVAVMRQWHAKSRAVPRPVAIIN